MENRAQDMSHTAREMVGQAQMNRNEVLNRGGSQNSDSIANQASSLLLYQAGEQGMSKAQGAADTVKNTLGMNKNNHPSSHTTNLPSYSADTASYTSASHPSH